MKLLPRFLLAVAETGVFDLLPQGEKELDGIFLALEQAGQGPVHDLAEHQACCEEPEPQVFDVVQAVLLRAVQVAIDAGVGKVWGLAGNRFSFFSETLDHGFPSVVGAAERVRC